MKLKSALSFSILGAAFALCSTDASADTASDCSQTKDLTRAIAACTEIIKSKPQDTQAFLKRGIAYFLKFEYDPAFADIEQTIRLDAEEFTAYRYRGLLFQIKGDDNRAIEDLSKAIELGEKDPWVLVDRGNVYAVKGDRARALADYDSAIQSDPKTWIAYLLRGISYTYAGELQRAQDDFKRGFQIEPKVPYFMIWLHIAERRANKPSSLAAARSKLDMTKWPAQAVRMFLGEETPDAVLARGAANVKEKKYGACESTFFVAEYLYQQKKREEAKRLYESSKKECRRNFVEWIAADAALKSFRTER